MLNQSASDSELSDFISANAAAIINNLLPTKSKENYLKTYEEFSTWRSAKGLSISESVLLVYFDYLSKTKNPNTLWCIYSKLKATINIKHSIEINRFKKLLVFLKRKSEGHCAKKSKIFTTQNVEKFLNEAPDEIFLATKVSIHDLTMNISYLSNGNYSTYLPVFYLCYRWP